MAGPIGAGTLVEVCEGPLLGVKGRVTGLTPGGRLVVRPSHGVVPPDLLSGEGTVAVVPCHCAEWDGEA